MSHAFRRGRFQMALWAAVASSAMVACQVGQPERTDAAECAAVVEHMIDLEFPDRPTSPDAAQLSRHRAAMKAAIRDRVVADCLTRPRAFTDCALAAPTSRAVGECR